MDKILEFTGNHTLLVLALVVSFLVVIFSELRRKASGTINIEASDAIKLINNGAIVVDLRSTEAYGRGHIVSSRSIPHDELEAKSSALGAEKTTPIVAVESVYGLKGGMNGWTQAGLPVVTGKKTKSKSGKGKSKKRS